MLLVLVVFAAGQTVNALRGPFVLHVFVRERAEARRRATP